MFNVVPFISSIGLAIVAEADLRFGDFSSQIGSFHYLLVLATECFFSFDIFQTHRLAFLGFSALWVVDDSWEFWVFDFGFFCF